MADETLVLGYDPDAREAVLCLTLERSTQTMTLFKVEAFVHEGPT